MQTAAVRRKIHECHGFRINIQNQAPGDPDQASDWFCHHFRLNEIRAEIIVRYRTITGYCRQAAAARTTDNRTLPNLRILPIVIGNELTSIQ